MNVRLGPVPSDPTFQPEHGPWRRLKEPSFGRMLLLSVPLAALMTAGMLLAWGAVARAHGVVAGGDIVLGPAQLIASLASVATLIVAHELAHAASLPGLGLTPATTLGFWPKAVTPYVTYHGELPRNRHVAVGVMPFLVLSAAPLLIAALTGWMPGWFVALSTLNALFSSGDLIGAAHLIAHTPPSSIVRSQGLETWWQPAPPAA